MSQYLPLTTEQKKLSYAYNSLSKLIFIEYFKTEADLVAISSMGKIVVFNTETLSSQGKNALGIKVIKLNDSSTLENVKKLDTVSFTNPEYYRFKNRGAGGNNLLKDDVLSR